ncbi:MAG: B12-binding domain-containing radical SAM protein [Acidobacteria bacterium]|nr:B12-binding domain-containing radical SAM protein [Acidobacteriota bacterium]
MAEVILIRPGFTRGLQFSDYTKESRPPAGLLYLAAPLVQNGFEVAIIDQTVERNWKNRLQEEINDKTLCIGITCLTGYMILNSIETVKFVRQYTQCPVVWGGVHPSLEVDTTITSEYVDIIAQGEGEETLLELATALKNKQDIGNIHGLIYKKNGMVYKNESRAPYDLNKLPALPFHLVDFNNYKGHYGLSRYFRFQAPVAVSLETSRGCTHRCSYCVMASNIYKGKTKWRGMAADQIANMVEDIVTRYDVHAFSFIDDNFFVDIDRAKTFLSELERRHLKIEWFADVRMDTIVKNIDIDFLKQLEQSGLRTLGIGIESGSDKMLKFIHKGETRATYIEANRILAASAIVPRYGILQGLPSETREDVEQTYMLVIDLLQDNPKCVPKLNKLLPTPGTPILEECVKRGFKPPQQLIDWAGYCDTSWMHGPKPWMDKEAAEFIMSQLYFNDLLLFAMARPKRGFIAGTALKMGTKLLTFRIKRKFYAFKFERFFHRIVRVPSFYPLLKRLYTIYLRFDRKKKTA